MNRLITSVISATLATSVLIFGSSAAASAQIEGSSAKAAQGSVVGSSEVPLSGPLVSSNPAYLKDTDSSITEAAVVDKQNEPGLRMERWTVASPAMQRNVSVQIMKPADPNAPAPMLYLLDGVGAPYNSGWVAQNIIGDIYDDENVTLVMPTQAQASMYSDWVSEDPQLGVNMWETFITEELAPLLEAEQELNFNGKRGIGGYSMGAIGAVQMANAHPGFFDATFGISCCYSTLDDLGRQMTNVVVESRGGETENMWGEYGSEEWISHDVTADPTGLRDTAVYLSTGNGVIDRSDLGFYADPVAMSSGVVLESGTHACTEALDESMREHGMDHQIVDYLDHGAHNLPNYQSQARPAWEAIKPALY